MKSTPAVDFDDEAQTPAGQIDSVTPGAFGFPPAWAVEPAAETSEAAD